MVSDDTAEDVAREFCLAFGDGAFADATALLTESGRERLVDTYPDEFREGPLDPGDALEGYWWGLYGQYGEFEGIDDVTAADGALSVTLRFADGSETATVEVDEGVTGFSFAPSYEPPGYADREAFGEREVTVDAGDVALDGVLTVPEGEGPFPGVVLVHGYGIHDPDGTAGSVKLLQDIAWGLASEGIASLRYAKRLADHEVADTAFTLDTVVIDDAVAALSELATHEAVAADRLFVAGHSQGGMCAPRIAERHGGVAGVVLLDPPADPVPDPEDLVGLRYSLEPDGELSEDQRAQLESVRETVRRIADGEFDPEETLMGRPGAWHRSHHELDPVATACGLDAPVFVLKTGRADETVQPELHEALRDRFETWRTAALPPGSRTELYGALDHYFQAGPTPVTQTNLYFGGSVSPSVVADVAEWIHATASVPDRPTR